VLADHEEVELVGIWGRDPAKAKAVSERHGVAAETDLDALLDRVDAVAIAVAPAAQPDLACRAAEANCHLLLEKPLALSTEDASRVQKAVEKTGVTAVSFLSLHYVEPGAALLRDNVFLGGFEGATATMTADIFSSRFKGSQWRRQDGVGLWDVGPHALSVLIPALGGVEHVTAVRGEGETVALALVHEGGRVSTATVSLTVAKEAEQFLASFWGKKGIVAYPPGGSFGSNEAAYQVAVSELLHAIGGNSVPRFDMGFSVEIVSVLAAAEAALGPSAR
jgi:predicted dehydrogenase